MHKYNSNIFNESVVLLVPEAAPEIISITLPNPSSALIKWRPFNTSIHEDLLLLNSADYIENDVRVTSRFPSNMQSSADYGIKDKLSSEFRIDDMEYFKLFTAQIFVRNKIAGSPIRRYCFATGEGGRSHSYIAIATNIFFIFFLMQNSH